MERKGKLYRARDEMKLDIIGNKKGHERWRTDSRRCLPPAGGGPRRWPRGWGGFCASKPPIPDNVYFAVDVHLLFS